MPRRYTRRRFASRGSRRSARRYRWVVVTGQILLQPQTYQAVELLTPTQPTTTLADSIYQSMTKPTIVAIMGSVTVIANRTYQTGVGQNGEVMEYAWGIYRDVDLTGSSTELPPFGLGYSNSWMTHKVGVVSSPSYNGTAFFGDYDLGYRRYDLNLRKYKRTLDSSNDSLIFVGESATASTATNKTTVQMITYFRILLLE